MSAMDPFPGDAPVPREKIKKYERGTKAKLYAMRTKYHTQHLRQSEAKLMRASRQAARVAIVQQEVGGFLEADEGEETSKITQHDLVKEVDVTSAAKFFSLRLDQFGPYRINYTRNGRQLLIGGAKGHIAAFDWQTKKLMCETNVMESINDVKWLHTENFLSVAQKRWTYIYDNQGIELHCLRILDQVLRLEFLPYHFLLAAANAKGYLSYIDVSVGQKVTGFQTGLGRLDVMCQNPGNAIVHLGHAGGTVTLWSPNVKEPLVKMLCHGSGTRSIAINRCGTYMATSGIDRTVKIWDLRNFKPFKSFKVPAGASNLSFSQRDLLAAGIGNTVNVYKDCCTGNTPSLYMRHHWKETVSGLQFCPFEDVLGIGYRDGFSSVLIPGSGEANIDALETNPYQTKKQRQQLEVKMLLEKVQPDMIALDTTTIQKVDTSDEYDGKGVVALHTTSKHDSKKVSSQKEDGKKAYKSLWRSLQNSS